MMGDWTFFSNYGHVLVCLARNREARLRDVALEVGITERAVQKIVRDLQDAGYLSVSKQGRCNRYRINRRKALRHNLESQCTVGKLLTVVVKQGLAEIDEIPIEEIAGQVRHKPKPKSKAIPQPEPRLEPAPEPKPRPEPEPMPLAAAKKEPEEEKPAELGEDAVSETREQGSLF